MGQMDFFTNMKTVAIVITLLEGVCIIYLRWVVRFLEEGHTQQRIFIGICSCLFMTFAWLFYGGKAVVGNWIYLEYGISNWIYTILLWDFFGTLMVCFDCIVLYYGIRIYFQIRKGYMSKAGEIYPPFQGSFTFMVWGLLFIVLATFVFYQYFCIHVYQTYRLSSAHVHRMSDFYRRISSVYFIIFEGSITVVALKIYMYLKKITEIESYDR